MRKQLGIIAAVLGVILLASGFRNQHPPSDTSMGLNGLQRYIRLLRYFFCREAFIKMQCRRSLVRFRKLAQTVPEPVHYIFGNELFQWTVPARRRFLRHLILRS